MKYILLLLSILLTGCAVTSDFTQEEIDTEWTIFRGSSSLNGYVDLPLPSDPSLAWTFKNDVRTVSSPIIFGGYAYTCDRKGVIRKIDENGTLVSQHDLNTPVEASFIIYDSTLYVGRIDGFISALSLRDMSTKWEYETLGQISGSPNLIRKGQDVQLLVGSYDNSMYTFDARNGQKKSQFETGYYINGAAAVWREFMVFGGCDAWLRIVNTQTGEQTDSLELNAYVPASPAIMDNKAYVADYEGNIYEVYLSEKGKFTQNRMLQKAHREGNEGSVAMPTISAESVFVLNERALTCIDRVSGRKLWSKMLRGDTGESSPLVCQDKVLVCTKDGYVSIFDAHSGSELWHYEVGEQIIASPAVINKGFYVLTTRGKLFFWN